MALTAPAAGAQSIDGLPESRFVARAERFTPDGGSPIDVTFLVTPEAASQTARLIDATHAALSMLQGWFGPLPSSALTVAGVPWPAHPASSRAGVAVVPVRWLAPTRDQSTERALIGAMVRQYWTAGAAADAFDQSLIAYITTRAIHQLLEGSNFAAPRFFGGFVPFPLRSVLLSPPVADPRPRVWDFTDRGDRPDDVSRGVRALQTIERYVGWPTLLEAISTLRTTTPGNYDAGSFAEVLSGVRGTDLRFLVKECLRADADFDYVLDGLESHAGADGVIETTVTIARRGTGVFAIRADGSDRDATMPVVVRFEDGTALRDYFDGAAPSVTRIYSAKSAAIGAAIDPDLMLLLDVNRDNNAVVRDARRSPLGVRLALHWLGWLQNAMLSYTALV